MRHAFGFSNMALPFALLLLSHLSGSGLGETTSADTATAVGDSDGQDDVVLIGARYRRWLLDAPVADDTHDFVRHQSEAALHRARRAKDAARTVRFDEPGNLYDTRNSGEDRREVHLLVTEILPDLAVAYHLQGTRLGANPLYQDKPTRDLILRAFDRLHARGFRPGMQMPWKAKDGRDTDPPTAIIVDFHLRTSGYALATFLMQKELKVAGRLERSLDTCEAICSHGEKTGDLAKLKLNADGVRIAVNFILPYALAAGNSERLRHLKRQLDRSMAIESDASDTIKPDGLGFHHLGVYLAGYAPYAVSQTARAAWLFRDTEYELAPSTIVNLRKSLLVLRVVSQKYDMHKALAGRLRSQAVIPDVLLGYAYLAALEQDGDCQMNRALARLADDEFFKSERAMRPFGGHRDEATPGPGAVDFFFSTLAVARELGAEAEPTGHWAFNYGPLSVHRRDDWMVSVKGFSKYLWAFERSLSDARDEERRQNVLGLHDSSCTIRIHSRGNPIGARESGYAADGWDWCRLPGATTRLIPAEQLLEMDQQGRRFNRPFGLSSFAGGASLSGRHGLFAMEYAEVGCDLRDVPLKANKSVFFFDDQIVVLASNIRDVDGVFRVGTTLYQSALSGPQVPTWVDGRSVVELEQEEHFAENRPLKLVDPVGNGYYIPRAQNVVVSRRNQESLDYTATSRTKGTFASAWFDHGVDPDNAECEFVILVRSGVQGLAEFAERAGDYYQVLQQDATAHVVTHHELGLTGYALFEAGTRLAHGVVLQADTPCLVLTKDEPGPVMRLSVCNPDLGWEYGKQFAFRPKDRPSTEELALPPEMPVRLTLRGSWRLHNPTAGVTVSRQAASTEVLVECRDAQSVEFALGRRQQ
jgi:chondroitin-sulfate-ABC endolyase/exolyase